MRLRDVLKRKPVKITYKKIVECKSCSAEKNTKRCDMCKGTGFDSENNECSKCTGLGFKVEKNCG